MTASKLSLFLSCLFVLALPAPGFTAGYHVYDWKGAAKEKDGREIRESRWQPGYVVTRDGERRAGEIMVKTVDGRIAEVAVKGDGKRKRTYATRDLGEFGLSLSVADLERQRGGPETAFGPGILELSDGRRLPGILGAASLGDGTVFSISYAPDRASMLTSYFAFDVNRAVMTIDGIEMEYQSAGDGFSKIPTLAEHRTFRHRDESRNPRDGSLVLADGESIEGQVLLVKDEDDGPALGAMLFGEDGYGVIWIASELARVTQEVDGRTRYWTSYGTNLEPLPTLREYADERRRDDSRNPHPGGIVLRGGQTLEGSVAFVKSKDGVNSIELYYFDGEGVPFSYGGSDVVQVTQNIDGKTHRYIPYQGLVFVELLARGEPYRLHANPFPEREDQFKTQVARGLLSLVMQGAAQQLGQQGLADAALLGVMGCEASGTCSSRNSLRDAVESMVPTFKKDEFVFRRADRSEVVLFKKNFDEEIAPLLERCPDYAALPRRDRKDLLDFDHPERAVDWLNDCAHADAATPVASVAESEPAEPGTVFRDALKNGARGPSMVVVPAGDYRMGDDTGRHANEIPVRRVSLARPFAVSQYEITLEEFDLFTSHTGRVRRTGQLSKQPRSPVRGIAWIDAVAYAQWLSGQTGKPYRLPTEAEWEYLARAGATTDYPWGDTVSADHVSCEACGGKKPRSEDVGRFPANEFGLFDVIGGVWEWVADCWHPEYSGAPGDGSAWMGAGDCNLRVVRGGSLDNGPEHLRLSFRTASSPVKRASLVGIRLVREL